jgi:aryl-alcohol dehydrogenase-like predicted oxidoreductase
MSSTASALSAPMAIGAGSFGGLGSPSELIGLGLDDADSSQVLTRAVQLGMTVVDTAHSYAAGAADAMIGSWLASDPARRNQIAIVAKLGIVQTQGGLDVDLSPDTVKTCAAQTRARLGTDRVDVIMSHAPDVRTPIATTLRAFVDLIEGGHADRYGVSNVALADLEAWLVEADALGVPPPALVENEYNLLFRDDERHVLPLCAGHGIGYLAASPLAGGLLTGKYRSGSPPPPGSYLAIRPDDRLDGLTERVDEALARFAAQAAKRGLSAAALGLAWVAAQPNVAPIVGVRAPAQLAAAADALAAGLSASEAAELGALFT